MSTNGKRCVNKTSSAKRDPDNHNSHCTFQETQIHALTIPSYSSHKIQRFDRCTHNSSKIFNTSACGNWMAHHLGRVITACPICPNFGNAAKARKPGHFGEEDFVALVVTERPLTDFHERWIFPSADGLPRNMPFREYPGE